MKNQSAENGAVVIVETAETTEQVMEEFTKFLNRIIERVEKARIAFRAKLDTSLYYSEHFQWEVKELARGEAVERECRLIRDYVLDNRHEHKLYVKLDTISTNIDTRRKNFRVNIERSTCGIRNEIENCRLEALHGFYFSPNNISDSHIIQEFCERAVQAD